MAMAVGGPKGGPRCDINMTPMIDILLVLLIIFMVITPLTPHGLEALAPEPPDKKNQPPPDQDRTVVIVIDKDKSMHINNEDTDMQKLGPRLEQIFKTRAERVVFVKGDPDLDFQTVAQAIDIAKGAQMDKIGLMTPKLEAGN
ncbi:MAG TPA: biopolymer transporter ExbD [Bryobacteraceae bacterium]|nr:biopolymer transporter ExbD [Bryobacteraceae bacterium]